MYAMILPETRSGSPHCSEKGPSLVTHGGQQHPTADIRQLSTLRSLPTDMH